MSIKVKRLTEVVEEIANLQTEMEADETKNTDDNRQKFEALHSEAMSLKKSIQQDVDIKGIKSFLDDPAGYSKAYSDGAVAPYQPSGKSIGEQFIHSLSNDDRFKSIKAGDKLRPGQANFNFETKDTFTSTSTGLDSTIIGNYVTPPGGMVMVEQQRLMVRDLLSTQTTTMASIPYIAETSFTNYADMVAEEGEKPEATLATEDRTAPVRKIAVLLKVTDEMFSDFPLLRDYINTRLRFMVLAKEEQQIVNGTGTGQQLTGILNTSGIQTQAKGANTNVDAIFKAITKVRNVGFFEPDAIVINPTDWELVKLAKDANNQYYGGGPFSGQYGVGGFVMESPLWGLKPCVTTAITAGTALVGAYKLGASLVVREGLTVDSTNSNEDDFNFNRVTLRAEERVALPVWRPLAFCTVTGIS